MRYFKNKRNIGRQIIIITFLLFFYHCKSHKILTNKYSAGISSQYLKQPMDMVLIYTGGDHRLPEWWNSEHFAPYVSFENDHGIHEWLFDGFLFLEIKNDNWSFFGRHGSRPARMREWELYVDRFFSNTTNIHALNHQISRILESKSDDCFEKRKIIIAIPEPKKGQKDWGELNGKKLDFNSVDDQITACRWYIDYVLKKWEKASDNLENVEFVAFYWIKENDPLDAKITQEVSSYVREKGYDFYWIPNMLGLQQINNDWKEPGYDKAYLQPGYFYRTDKDSVRLRQSSELIDKFKLNPYVEFDERTLIKNRNWGYRLHKTIDIFEEYGFWDTTPIGYYQGFNGLYQLYNSEEPEDKILYMRLAKIISQRQNKRYQSGY